MDVWGDECRGDECQTIFFWDTLFTNITLWVLYCCNVYPTGSNALKSILRTSQQKSNQTRITSDTDKGSRVQISFLAASYIITFFCLHSFSNCMCSFSTFCSTGDMWGHMDFLTIKTSLSGIYTIRLQQYKIYFLYPTSVVLSCIVFLYND